MIFTIKKPLVTEKSSGAQNEQGFYTFQVQKAATKIEIKKAVQKQFDVKVKSIKTLVCRGKAKKTAKGIVKPRYWKKALVKLKTGEQIKMFEGGAN